VNGEAGTATDERRPKLPLRERKKLRTRETIVRAGLELFVSQGLAKTTVADIAAAAEIAPSTFFTYFKTKQDLLFHHQASSFREMSERIETRPGDRTTVDVIEATVLESMPRVFGDPLMAVHARIFSENPALDSEGRRRWFTESYPAHAHGFARDLGARPGTETRASLLAHSAIAIELAYREYWVAHAEETDLAGPRRFLAEAIAMLRASLDDARARLSPS
jgi:TetR/AcrR family transcriptional regulator, regulator of mycofactocin system